MCALFDVSLIIVQGKVTETVLIKLISIFEDKDEPKRGVEPASFRLPPELLTTRPSRLTGVESASFRLPAELLTTRPSRLTRGVEAAPFRLPF